MTVTDFKVKMNYISTTKFKRELRWYKNSVLEVLEYLSVTISTPALLTLKFLGKKLQDG